MAAGDGLEHFGERTQFLTRPIPVPSTSEKTSRTFAATAGTPRLAACRVPASKPTGTAS
ncbi:hypothetical protein [Streptomyces triculaminicus]|uniref:hypothetical protein n=1 Tax=Streptomyces triculaminicus TaxID=2816232 RepID=UPI0037D0892F